MNTQPSPFRPDGRFWELHQSASNLTRYACMVSARHIQDGVLRGQFNRDMAYYVRQVLEDVRNGRLRTEDGLRAIELEQKSFEDISLQVGGLIAGGFMTAGGVVICYGSAMTLCAVAGGPMVAHGVNNMYENGANLVTGRSDTVGLLKKAYEGIAVAVGGTERHGRVAYGATDAALSFYGLGRLVPKPGAWQLFRSIRADYVRAYTLMSGPALLFELGMSGWTIIVTLEEAKK